MTERQTLYDLLYAVLDYNPLYFIIPSVTALMVTICVVLWLVALVKMFKGKQDSGIGFVIAGFLVFIATLIDHREPSTAGTILLVIAAFSLYGAYVCAMPQSFSLIVRLFDVAALLLLTSALMTVVVNLPLEPQAPQSIVSQLLWALNFVLICTWAVLSIIMLVNHRKAPKKVDDHQSSAIRPDPDDDDPEEIEDELSDDELPHTEPCKH